jgi:6-phosphogluconolactonase
MLFQLKTKIGFLCYAYYYLNSTYLSKMQLMRRTEHSNKFLRMNKISFMNNLNYRQMRMYILNIAVLFLICPIYASEVNVYFSSGKAGIYHATLNKETGKLSDAELVAEIERTGFLALHPDKQKLYAVGIIDGKPVVTGYEINGDGSLTEFTVAQSLGGRSAHIAVHPTGKFILTAQYGNGSVELFELNENGELGKSTVTKHEGEGSKVVMHRQKKPHPHWCGYSPDGKYAFVPDLGKDGIFIYRIDMEKPSIKKHAFAASVPGAGPRHMRFSVDGAYIFCLNELNLTVTTYQYNADKGTAEQLITIPTLVEEIKAKEEYNSAAEILVHPSGKFIYTSNRGNDSVTVFSLEAKSGELTLIEVEPIRGAWPRNINLGASGTWLLAAGAHSNTVSVFSIDDNTGELMFQRNNVINIPQPNCILFAE